MFPIKMAGRNTSAVVLLSGGLDSATTLAIAKQKHKKIYCLSFQYGQKHSKELKAAKGLARFYGAKHTVLQVQMPWKGSSLLDSKIKIPVHRSLKKMSGTIPSTYVPARNTVFLSFALSLAETIGAGKVFIGVNALDYSGYPDCRPKFLKAMEKVFFLGTKTGAQGKRIKIQAPLLKKTKAQIVRMGKRLEVPYQLTWSCYTGGKKPCGKCDSCLLRAKGFKEAGIADPLLIEG